MPFKILVDTFSVARDSSHFLQTKIIKKPRTEEQLLLVVEINGETKYARSTFQNILETAETVFFADPELESYERFESALKEINLIIKNLKEKRGPKALGEISAILAVFSGNELHLTQSKHAEAYLVRKGKLSLISEGLGGKSDDLFVNIASGELLPEDKIIFATSRVLRLVAQSQFVQIVSDGVTEAVDALRELVMAENELSMAVACLHVKLPLRAMESAISANAPAWLNIFRPWFEKLSALAKEKISAKLPMPKIAARMPKWKLNVNKKSILAAILAIIVLLVISVSLMLDGRRNEALRGEYSRQIEALNQDLATATQKGYANEKETANAILDKVERESRNILAANFFRNEVMMLLKKIQDTRDSINNTLRVKDAKPYVDLKTKKNAVRALGLLNLDEKFFVYEYNSLFEVILDQVLDPKPLDENEVVKAASAMEDQGLLAFLTQSGRIMEYQDEEVHFANTDDSGWQEGVDLAAYGRNLYLLSPAKNQIFKYSRLRSNFSGASEYNTDADLAGAISLAIDGNIYVLKTGGEILKLFKSKVQPFKIEALAVDISSVSKLFTTIELDNLYLLDPLNKRVVVVEKDRNGIARYAGQVIFDGLEGIHDLYVEKSGSKLYLLSDTAIYKIEL